MSCLRNSGISIKDNPNLSGSSSIPGMPPMLFKAIIELNPG